VTFDEWDACIAAGGCKHRPGDEGWGRGRRPVINVSWNDAKEYVAWLSKTTGKSYRMLSEAEWEYAARAGTTTPFSTGETISTEQANYDGNYTYAGGSKGTDRRKMVPVGSFKPNAFGLHDMHGNVWEWVEDPWHDSYKGAPTDGSAWAKDGDRSRRILRGGSWGLDPRLIRSALRGRLDSVLRGNYLGFRVARSLTR
jgi:formylglycine-generating enzyme required for sulfatase activity